MQEKKISVLMGIYNCGSTLGSALDSLMNQSFKDFKVILCEDGSSDNTLEVATAYSKQYDNIIPYWFT